MNFKGINFKLIEVWYVWMNDFVFWFLFFLNFVFRFFIFIMFGGNKDFGNNLLYLLLGVKE